MHLRFAERHKRFPLSVSSLGSCSCVLRCRGFQSSLQKFAVTLCTLLLRSDHPELAFGLLLCWVPQAPPFWAVDQSILKVHIGEQKTFILFARFFLSQTGAAAHGTTHSFVLPRKRQRRVCLGWELSCLNLLISRADIQEQERSKGCLISVHFGANSVLYT